MSGNGPTSDGHQELDDMDQETGVYVYGFGRSSDAVQIADDGHFELYRIEAGDIVAWVRTVALSEYSEEALKDRADDQAWLVAEAQKHHAVVATIHQQAPFLPGKFGSVYASESDVCEAMRNSSKAMLERLNALDGCDEWAAHVFLQNEDLTEIVLSRDPDLRELAAELDGASEGRSYMLKQRIQSRMKDAVEHYEMELADRTLEEIRSVTTGYQVETPAEPETTPEGEREIARASMLVSRDRAERFVEQAERSNQEIPEVWLKITGPWPAYSFAQVEIEDESDRNG